jgi:predicted PurR-regulated permease PerM
MGILAYLILGGVIAVLCWALVTYLPGANAPPWSRWIPAMGVVLWVLLGLVLMLGGVVHDVPMPKLR